MSNSNERPWKTHYWWVPVEIPFFEISVYMTEEQADKWAEVYNSVFIELSFSHHPADRETGYAFPYWSYEGDWALPRVGNYPDVIKDAITDYLNSIDCTAVYEDAAEEYSRHAISLNY